MQIIFKYDEFLFSLFPEAKQLGSDSGILLKEIKKYYTIGPFEPSVKLEDDLVMVEIKEPEIKKHEKDYKKVIELSNKGKFDLAKPILLRMIRENPSVSEYHRILGQILSEEGKQDEAIDKLIDALKWNPDNTYALLMMGNIFAKYKNDTATAVKYYDQSLASDPNNHITLNNIGATLLMLNKLEEGKRYLEMAYEVKADYPNTLYNLSSFYKSSGDTRTAFEYAVKAVKVADENDPMAQQLSNLLFAIARSYLKEFDASLLVDAYIDELEERANKKIKKEIGDSISTSAKIEFAEYYNRDYHLIKYKQDNPAFNHLIMHELVHLDLVLQARGYDDNVNKLFSVRSEHKLQFNKDHEEDFDKLRRHNFPDDVIKNFTESLFTGMNNQIYNAPLDLFIEEFLYNKFPKLRPVQFLSLETLLMEGIKAVTTKERKLIPPNILRASTILNLVTAFHLKYLYGVDYTPLFKAPTADLKLANQLFDDYQRNKNDHKPGDEYNFVIRWAGELELNKYFEFIPEKEYNNSDYLTSKLKEISEDPFGLENPLPDDAIKKPLNYDDSPAGKMAVTMYCLDALNNFVNKTPEQIKEIGYEIAMLARHGLDPSDNEKRIHIASIPNKEFTPLHLLAFMYVAWQSIEPGLDLNLDFKDEYLLAKQMFEKK